VKCWENAPICCAKSRIAVASGCNGTGRLFESASALERFSPVRLAEKSSKHYTAISFDDHPWLEHRVQHSG
jgi:hypothetical protein